jgi:hypothetical protein
MAGPCCFTSRSRQKNNGIAGACAGVLAAIEQRPNRRRPRRTRRWPARSGRAGRAWPHPRSRASVRAVRSASDSWRWTEHLARAVADELLIGQRDVAIHVVDRDLGGDAREPQPRAGPNVPQHPRSLAAPCVVLDSDTSRRDE